MARDLLRRFAAEVRAADARHDEELARRRAARAEGEAEAEGEVDDGPEGR